MKELLLRMARYNQWANKKIIDVLLQAEDVQLDQEVVSSFPSLRKTVYHSIRAEHIWLQRLQLVEQPLWFEDVFHGTFADACALWQQTSAGLVAFVERQFDDRSLRHVFQYYNQQKISFKQPVSETLQHVFNHSTFHRGQLVTLLRQTGTTKLPATDYAVFMNLR